MAELPAGHYYSHKQLVKRVDPWRFGWIRRAAFESQSIHVKPLLAWMRSEVKISKACNCLTGLPIRQVAVLSPQERP